MTRKKATQSRDGVVQNSTALQDSLAKSSMQRSSHANSLFNRFSPPPLDNCRCKLQEIERRSETVLFIRFLVLNGGRLSLNWKQVQLEPELPRVKKNDRFKGTENFEASVCECRSSRRRRVVSVIRNFQLR